MHYQTLAAASDILKVTTYPRTQVHAVADPPLQVLFHFFILLFIQRPLPWLASLHEILSQSTMPSKTGPRQMSMTLAHARSVVSQKFTPPRQVNGVLSRVGGNVS